MTMNNKEALDALLFIVKRGNASGFIGYAEMLDLKEAENVLRATLSAPRVPEIEGLEDALKKYSFDMPDMSDYESVGHYLDDEAEYRKASSIVEKAARAYFELQKGV